MRLFFSGILAAFFLPLIAAAEGVCKINGEVVPCGDMPAWFVAFPILFGLIGLAFFVFWIMMLAHAIKHPIENKPLWIIVLIVGQGIGAIVYYFAVKRHVAKVASQSVAGAGPTVPPAAPPVA